MKSIWIVLTIMLCASSAGAEDFFNFDLERLVPKRSWEYDEKVEDGHGYVALQLGYGGWDCTANGGGCGADGKGAPVYAIALGVRAMPAERWQIRVELEAGYRKHDVSNGSNAEFWTLFFNIWPGYEIVPGWVTLYGGGGVGALFYPSGYPGEKSSKDHVTALQAGGGLDFRISRRLSVDVGYKGMWQVRGRNVGGRREYYQSHGPIARVVFGF